MGFYSVSDLVPSKSCIGIALINIIWILGLVEVRLSIISVPFKHVAQGVFASKTVSSNAVSINLETSVNWIGLVFNETTSVMISSPEPSVIDDDVATVNLDHNRGFDFILIWSTDTGEDIMHGSWVFRFTSISLVSPREESRTVGFTGL